MVEEEGNLAQHCPEIHIGISGCRVRDHTEHMLLPRAGDSEEE